MLFFTMACYAHTERQWIDNKLLSHDAMSFELNQRAAEITIEACGAMKGLRDKRGENNARWGLEFTLANGMRESVVISWGNTDHGNELDSRYLKVSHNDTELNHFSSRVSVYEGDNTLICEIDSSNTVKVYVGSDYINYAGTFTLPAHPLSVALMAGGTLELHIMCIECVIPLDLESGLSEEEITEACRRGQQPPLGLWHYFDRENDTSMARPGGKYDLVIVEDPNDYKTLLIIYLGGATVNSRAWHRGMIKGRLRPMSFRNRSRLEWYDAAMQKVDDEANALLEGDILTFYFPLLKTQLRYSR